MSENIEQEFKWDATAPESFERFERALVQAEICVQDKGVVQLTDFYLDDERDSLSSQKIALRVRRQGARWEATLKSRSKLVNGLAVRQEYKKDLTGVRTLSGAIVALERREQWKGAALKNLSLTFTIKNKRHLYEVRGENCECEAALDDYITQVSGYQLRRKEIELELKKGAPEDFKKLVKKLTQTSGLKPVKLSKVAGAEKWISQNFRLT